MNNSKVTVAGIFCLLLFVGQAGGYEIYSTKKGVGQVAREAEGLTAKIQMERVEGLHCNWYYTWGIKSRSSIINPAIEFVPMMWGGNSLPGVNTMTADLATLFTPAWSNFATVTNFLGFNEPDHDEQANMTVTKALDVWPLLEAAAAANGIPNIGSPACTGAEGSGGTWVTNFMAGVSARGLQVDFMAFHDYPTPTGSSILTYAATYYSRYGKDVWVTEFNAADWTPPNNYTQERTYTWMAEMLYRLESTPYIKRYAIFPWDGKDGEEGAASHVFEVDVPSPGVTNYTSILTPLGKLYANYRPSDTNGPYPGVTYYLHNKANYRRLFDNGSTPLTTNVYTEGNAVDFRLVDAGSGNYFIFNTAGTAGSNKRLGYNGTSLSWATNGFGSDYQWSLTNVTNGWKYITHPASTGQLLGTSGNGLTMGAASSTTDVYRWAFIRSNTGTPAWTNLVSDDFETGWGHWVGGVGSDAGLTSTHAMGAQCVFLRDNSGEASAMTNSVALDLTGYSEARIEFTYMPVSMEGVEDFWVQLSTNGGSTWADIKRYVNGTDFTNNTRQYPVLTLDSGDHNFTTNVKFRFQCDASDDSDLIYIDDVVISGYAGVSNNIPPFFQSSTVTGAAAGADAAYSSSIAGSAVDLDNDTLTYSKVSGPSWLNIATNGALSGTPGMGDLGTNTFSVLVSDGRGGTNTATLNIPVEFFTVLVGGSTLNGDFNNPAAGATFAQLVSWVQIGTGGLSAVATFAGTSNNNYNGTAYSSQGYMPSNKIFGLNTGYSIVDGDIFDISYIWKYGYLWDGGSDQIRVSLFVTSDNTINGTRANLVQNLSGLAVQSNTYESVDHDGIYTASASDAGKTLFVAIDTTITNMGYAYMDNFELIVSPSAVPSGYDFWRLSYGMTGTLAVATNDYDLDGWKNLLEYGLAGNPTNPAVNGTSPVLGAITWAGGTNWIEYIHLQRTNANHGLTYTLEQTTDLVNQPWTNCTDAVVAGSGPAADSDFMTVTNRIPIDGEDKKFIRLRIGQ